jgi:hypothetical protein
LQVGSNADWISVVVMPLLAAGSASLSLTPTTYLLVTHQP